MITTGLATRIQSVGPVLPFIRQSDGLKLGSDMAVNSGSTAYSEAFANELIFIAYYFGDIRAHLFHPLNGFDRSRNTFVEVRRHPPPPDDQSTPA